MWFPLQMNIQVVEVHDGDTLTVKTGRGSWSIRLAGIDAPELGQPSRLGGQDAGIWSRECLKRILRGQKWQLAWRGRDVYGRVLGDLYNETGSLSQKSIEQGCVSLYPFLQDFSRHERRELKQMLGEAQNARRGLWAFGGYMRPRAWRKLQKTSRRPVAAE